MGVICIECFLIPGTQAQGCRVILDCDNGDLSEKDFIRSGLTAIGCLPVVPSTPTICTLLFYDIEQNSSASSDPAAMIANVTISVLMYTATTVHSQLEYPTMTPVDIGMHTEL